MPKAAYLKSNFDFFKVYEDTENIPIDDSITFTDIIPESLHAPLRFDEETNTWKECKYVTFYDQNTLMLTRMDLHLKDAPLPPDSTDVVSSNPQTFKYFIPFLNEWSVSDTPREPLQIIRQIRNNKLSESDWTQLPGTLPDEKKAAWAVYRQLLRELPQTLDMASILRIGDVVWPTPP